MKGWRTIMFNVVASIPPILEVVLPFAALDEFTGILPASWIPWWALFVALGNMYLRTITTTPVGKKE